MERNRFPNIDMVLTTTLYITRMPFEVHKWVPSQVAKFKAIIDKCTMFIHILCMGFLQLITDGSPNKHPREKEQQGEEREENASGYLQKNNRQ